MDGMTAADPGSANPNPGRGSSDKPSWLWQVWLTFVDALPALSNIAALGVLLWFAIGATCEIVNRNEDYARVAAYEKFLIGCRNTDASTDKGCPKTDDGKSDAEFWIKVASNQVRNYNSLNALGAIDRCHVAAVIASPVGHFWEDCLIVLGGAKDAKLETASSRPALTTIIHPATFTYRGWPFGFDERPKEPLYFLLVLASAAIGATIAGLRTKNFSTHRDLALGVGAGFAIYLLLRGGNFVFFTGSAGVDILNPFTAATVGLLVGLFNDKAFALLNKAMPDALSAVSAAAVQTASKAVADSVAAAKKVHEDLVTAIGKTAAGSPEQKALQDIATEALAARTKAEEAAKAQGEAFKPA